MKKFLAAGAVALAAMTLTTGTTSAGNPSITEIAAGNPDFETLTAAVTAAGFADTFSNCAADAPKFTVFAPTDDAFAALPAGTLDTLLAEPGLVTLTDILKYHVLAGEVNSTAAIAAAGTSVPTLNGDSIAITVVDGKVTLNGSVTVTMADIPACNGIIHVIDAVLMPPADTTTMPNTGSNLTLTVIALGLLAMGSMVVLGARRRVTA